MDQKVRPGDQDPSSDAGTSHVVAQSGHVWRHGEPDRRAEVEARANEAMFRHLLESTPDALLVVAEDGTIRIANRAASRLLRYEPNELLGLHIEALVPEPARAAHPTYRAAFVDSGETRPMGRGRALRVVRRDGTEIPVEVSLSPVATGIERLTIATLRDVSERLFEQASRERSAHSAGAEEGRERLTFLAEASTALSASLDYHATIATVARLIVPRLADWCVVHVAGEDTATPLAIAHIDPAKVAWAHELQRRFPPRDDQPSGVFHVMRTGVPELYPEITDDLLRKTAQSPEHLEILRAVGMSSAMVVPLTARQQPLGALTLISATRERTYGPDDLDLATHVAARCAQAIENAQLYRRAQNEIAERRRVEEQFQTAFRSSPSALYVARMADGVIVEVNDRWTELVGHARADVIGRPTATLGISRRPEDLVATLAKLHAHGRLEAEAMELRHKSGEILQVLVSADVIDIGGEQCVLGFVEDVTERRRAEAALAAEKERLAVTLRSIGDGVVATDTDGRVTLMNVVAEQLTGWSTAEACGRPIDEVFCIVHHRTREPLESPVTQVLATGAGVDLANHTALIARNGTERVVADSGAPIRDETGRIIGVVLVFRDVTAQERIEEELQRTSKLDSLGVLAGGIAHDFNNIMTGILANLSLARLDVTGQGSLVRRLLDAEKATLRARELTQQLLTFAKGGEPIRKPTSLATIIRDSTSFALSGSNVSMRLDLATDLRSAEVDQGQIGQVIQNLVINAKQVMPHGGIVTVTGTNVEVGAGSPLPLPPGPYVRIAVSDEGPGISPAHLPLIFDPFFTTKAQGSGLGLATAHSIVSKHDGHVGVERSGPDGSRFAVYLPAVQAVPTVDVLPDTQTHGEGRILVMDDEPIMRETLSEVLSVLGYDAVVTSDGAEAVAIYRDALEHGERFDIVILDLTVPGGMGGRRAVELMREIDPSVRAIVSSGYSDDPIMANYKDFGFRGVAAKPYTLAELQAVLQSVMDAGC